MAWIFNATGSRRAGWDRVVGEWRAGQLAIHRLVGERIENHVLRDGSPGHVGAERASRQGLAEIPGSHQRGGHGLIPVRGARQPVFFQVEKEEGLVTAVVHFGDVHGAAQGEPIVIASELWSEVVPTGASRVRPARAEIFVAIV